MKILVICRAFDNMAGGVERMAVAMMGALCERGHDVTLLTWDQAQARPFYTMDPRIKWHKLDMGDPEQRAGWLLRLQRGIRVRKMVRSINPNVMIGFQHGAFLAMRLFTLGLCIPIIAAERNAPARFDFLSASKKKNFIFLSFLLADCITIQCESYRNQYPVYLRSRIRTIPNPVFPALSLASPAGRDATDKTLLAVGRISYQKNFDALLIAFSKICDEFPDWRLLIAGDGEDRSQLMNHISRLGLESRVTLAGAVNDVGALYCASHIFCLPSRWEGFPNALAEAMSHGLPAVGFADCAGVRDLIEHQKNGLLAEGNGDPSSLEFCLRVLMKDADMRERMGAAGILAMRNYTPQRIFDCWEHLFKKVAKA